MITEVKYIDPFWCGWDRDPYEYEALAYAWGRIPLNVANVVSGVDQQHFLYLLTYGEELAWGTLA